MMPVKCEICNYEFLNESYYQSHLQGKKHLKNVQQSEIAQSMIQRSIYISHLPQDAPTHSLLQFFSQFGEIYKHRFGRNYLIIEFKTKEPVQFLLNRPIYYDGIQLKIHPRILGASKKTFYKNLEPNIKPEYINNTEDLKYNNIKSIFEIESTFDEQLSAFLEKIVIADHLIESCYEPTCKKINQIFKSIFPDCQTHRFGSTVTGLGFKNCDLDIYMDIGIPVTQEYNGQSGPNLISTATVFSEVKKILYSRPNLFSKVIPIPRAKTPIIKFTFLPTQISCDISFKNRLAVRNSQLIRFYLSLNPCFLSAMMVLKYWVSNNELKGGEKMSKYALSMLFIFYLQQPSLKLVPPIIDLKKTCVPEIVEGWQANFDSNYENDQNDCKNKSVSELLHGFFDFYAKYDFKSNIVCPIDGNSYNRTLFKNVESLPESMDRYKEYLKTKENPVQLSISFTKAMCVQDPNELNHNITANLSTKYVEIFQGLCAAASKVCVKTMENNFKDLLPSIFTLTVEIKGVPIEIIDFTISARNVITAGLPDDFEIRTNIEDRNLLMTEHWFDLVLNLIKMYFEKVLKLELQFVHPEPEIKQLKVETNSDVHSEDQNKIIIRCMGNHSLWRDRKNKSIILDPTISMLEKEIQISENKLKDKNSEACDKLINMNIDFLCQIIKRKQSETHLHLTLTDNGCTKRTFAEIGNYIKHKMPHILLNTLIHMQQFKRKSIP